MSDPVFLQRSGGLTTVEIAAMIGAVGGGGPSAERRIFGIASLDRASPADLTFFDDKRFKAIAARTYSGACLTTSALAAMLPPRVATLVVDEPYRAFVEVARALFPGSLQPSSFYDAVAAEGAHVHPTARLEANVTVEPGAVIGPGVEIGGGTVIGANAVVGAEVRIGRDCAVGAGAAVSNALIGDRVILHEGCRIGHAGLDFVTVGERLVKVPQVGRVIIQDAVEVGAGATIDRGAIRDTVIGEGTKIDNLVQVGHNVTIGRRCMVVTQAGIAAGVTLEDFVVVGARCGLNGCVTIGEGAEIAAASMVHGDVPPGARWSGAPAKPLKR
jgi:UDP-3-O-[3-hydroxymyristoyl] glucosamine N-acyltransferase